MIIWGLRPPFFLEGFTLSTVQIFIPADNESGFIAALCHRPSDLPAFLAMGFVTSVDDLKPRAVKSEPVSEPIPEPEQAKRGRPRKV